MTVRPIRSVLALVLLAAAVAAGEEKERARLTWNYVGYARLRPAAAAAKELDARLLVGVDGESSASFAKPPLSTLLNEPGVATAAKPFVRVLVRPPETWFLVRSLGAKRPGLLVLDAGGCVVDTLDLAPALDRKMKPARVVEFLDQAARASPVHQIRFVVTGGKHEQIGGFWSSMQSLEGSKVTPHAPPLPEPDGTTRESEFVPDDRPAHRLTGTCDITELLSIARSSWVRLEILDPVTVVLRAREGEETRTVYRERVLLRAEEHPGFVSDVEELTVELDGAPTPATAVRTLRAPFGLKGVLHVIPEFDAARVIVVARRGQVKLAALRRAIEEAGTKTKSPAPKKE
jgi:hypothetical protein